ncbi:MAG: (S)-benzoin forming benzil reductase [Bacteroidota bacterium]
MHLFIITGTSRGIGAALAESLLDPNHALLCISRSENADLVEKAAQCGCPVEDVHWDLSETEAAALQFDTWLDNRDFDQLSSINFIQNAGVLDPIEQVHGDWLLETVTHNLAVNLVTPMAMTGVFVRYVQELDIPKRLLNISSGAGRRPIPGWSAYCTSKAGLDMFSQCLAAEQQAQEWPIQVVSLAPGTVDTAMQDQIRATNQAAFPPVERFHQLKAEGKLWSPEKAAQGIVGLLQDPDFGEEVLLDLRNRMD